MDKPYYPYSPIASIDALSLTLGVIPDALVDIAKKSSSSYTEFIVPSKNKDRLVYEPKHDLKRIQKRINTRIFEKVEYPRYLQGGIKDALIKRDYVENASLHTTSKHLINLDIKSFYDNIKSCHVFSVYKYFFKFPDDVCEMLTSLTTYKSKVPQGACTSSYIANLIFFNSEYSLVSSFRQQGIIYTRLLDDVTLSSNKELTEEEITKAIKDVSALFRKYDLRLKNNKTKIELKANKDADYKVTGLWIGNGAPRVRKHERRYIRQLVYVCSLKYKESSSSKEYHDLWNKVSGMVAKLTRLKHSEASSLRSKLTDMLPTFADDVKRKIIHDIKKLMRKPDTQCSYTHGEIARVNKAIYLLGILGRTDRNLANNLRRDLKRKYKNLPTYNDIWS
ncbi:RNA-directed DNA polymerase [Aeromonas veronii]|uniref:reverse transcriptase family protein n=1 Tax=Aeromonas veronii TaxID=654 RepID=UPI0015CF9A4B|nr:reverse transcriptase family protein [Aeromonas veronii]QLH68869.1 RNA-directed DNA polymerase [Aeromonas veronii]